MPLEPALRRVRDWPLSLRLIAVLALVLLPLGVVAALLSLASYRAVDDERRLLAISRFDAAERVISANLDADFTVLRTALLDAPGEIGRNRAIGCALLRRAATFDAQIRYLSRVDARGTSVCGVGAPPSGVVERLRTLGGVGGERFRRAVIAEPRRGAFWLIVRDDGVRSVGDAVIARVSTSALKALLPAGALGDGDRLTVSDGPVPVLIWGDPAECPAGRCIEIERPIGNAGLWLELVEPRPEVTLAQAGSIGLPLIMWLVTLAIGWWAARTMVARPLVRLQRAVESYRRGDVGARVGDEGLGSREMGEFAAAFDRMADELGRQEADLRAALAEQKRLTRDVHHRVKNNLQIVSSLVSIEARAARSSEVAHAYATVQARVSALALVHHWVYDDAGAKNVDLRALLTDLVATLEQQLAASEGIELRLNVDVGPLFVGPDTAVPVAFTVTELVGCAAREARATGLAALEATITAAGADDRARLTIAASVFKGVDVLSDREVGPVQRIVTGMVRQLRGQLTHDGAAGTYTIAFPLPALTG